MFDLLGVRLRVAAGLSVLALAGAVGCSDGDSSLVSTSAIGPGDQCPAGGTRLLVGNDKNHDGKLQDSEAEGNPQIFCTQSSSAATVTALTTVAGGDAHCRAGGTRIDVGLDNGDNGGTAGNGVLEPGEIESTQYDCSSGPGESSLTPPDGPAGTATINLDAGASTGGDGAAAYGATLVAQSGTFGGHLKLLKTGAVDASFSVPDATYGFGSHPWTVNGAATLKNVADTTTLSSGDVYTLGTDETVFQWDGSTGVTVTGIQVSAGATLTIAPNSANNASIELSGSFVNAGIVTTPLNASLARATLAIRAVSVGSLDGASFALAGGDSTSAAGGAGGALALVSYLTLINRATVDVHGGAGTVGGASGSITMLAGQEGTGSLYNTGAIDGHGGNGSAGAGGTASSIVLIVSSVGNVFNSGSLSVSGGTGTGSSTGAAAGTIYMFTQGLGSATNSGAISGNGGDAGASCTGGCGGNGVSLVFFVSGGPVTNSGSVTGHGGASAAGTAGGGGQIVTLSNPTTSNFLVPMGSIRISGGIDLHGGSGLVGGSGGTIQFSLNPTGIPSGAEIALLGYTSLSARGGNGTTKGGNGGAVTITHSTPFVDTNGNYAGPSGSFVVATDINTSGGTASAGDGGSAGTITARTQTTTTYSNSLERGIVTGSLTAVGGNGTAQGGNGGSMDFAANDGLTVSGAITLSGGAGTSNGGYAGALEIRSGADATVSSTIVAAGGAGSNGGQGTTYFLTARQVTVSGSVTSSGGNGSGGSGGYGGDVVISSSAGTTASTGSVTVQGGTGTPAGQNGTYILDGALLIAL